MRPGTFVCMAALAVAFGVIVPPRAHAAPSDASANTNANASGRKEEHLAAPSPIEKLVRDIVARDRPKLPRNTQIVSVHTTTAAPIPKNRTNATIEITPPTRRVGRSSTSGIVTFRRANDIVARVPVALELEIPPEGVAFDVPKGAPVVLVLRRSSFEVTSPAVTAHDGDVGDVVSVLLRPSGRSLRATLIAKDRAVAILEPR